MRTGTSFIVSTIVALKTEFDSKSYYIVLVRAFTGAVLGSAPGIVYIFATGHNVNTSTFGVSLIQLGAGIGTIALGLAATAATIVATMKNRGAGQQSHKAKKFQEYMSPEQLPVIPPSMKPEVKEDKAVQAESKPVAVSQEPARASMPAVMPQSAAALQSEQPSFQDFDQTH